MKKIVLIVFLFVFVISCFSFQPQKARAGLETINIKASYHNWTDSGYPTYAHYNGQPYMNVGYYPGADRKFRSYVYFDLSSIPAGSTINSASLNLWLQNDFWLSNPIDHTDCTGVPTVPLLVVGQIVEAWDSSMNWNSQPGHLNPTTYDLTRFPCNDQERFYYISTTQIVKNWFESGQANYGFVIVGTESGNSWNRRFAGSTGTEIEKPQLYIQYTTPVTPPADDDPADSPATPPAATTITGNTANTSTSSAVPTINPTLKKTDSSIASPTLTFLTINNVRNDAPLSGDMPITIGDSLIVSGKGTAGLTISLAIGDKIFSGVVNADGSWEISIDTSTFIAGLVKAKAQAQNLNTNKGSAETELFGLEVSEKKVANRTPIEPSRVGLHKLTLKEWLVLGALTFGLILTLLVFLFRTKIFKVYKKLEDPLN